MQGVPRDVGDYVDASLCHYDGFFCNYHVFYVPVSTVELTDSNRKLKD